MKLTTIRTNFNRTVKIFDGKELEFDHKGICEVKDKELANKIINHYSSFIWDSEQVVETKAAVNPVQDKITRNYEEEIVNLKSQIESIKGERDSAKADKLEWAKLSEKKDKEIEELTAKYATLEEVSKKEKQYFELKITLLESTTESIKTICEKSGYPKEEWEKKGKGELIEYVLNKV